jgi:DNA repair exonuclease SbcCD ATPase subunit
MNELLIPDLDECPVCGKPCDEESESGETIHHECLIERMVAGAESRRDAEADR